MTKRMARLMDEVAEIFGVTPEEMRGPSRKMKYVAARQAFVARAYAERMGCMTHIAEALNRTSHSVVVHYLRKLGLKPGRAGAVPEGVYGEEMTKVV